MPRFRRAAALVAVASLTALAACGGDGGASKSAAPAGDSSAAPSSTAPAGDSSAAPSSTAPARTPLELVLASSQKVAESQTMRFALTMGMPQGSFTGEGALDTAGPTMTMTMDMGSLLPAGQGPSTVSMILQDQVMYMQYPGLAAETGGKEWIRLDLGALGAGNPLAPLATQLRNADPSQSLGFLDGAEDVTVVGSETVRGVATTHYRFTVDLQKALDAVPADLRSTVSTAISQLGMTTLPGDVWLDADGLPRRFTYDMTLPVPGAPQTMHFSLEFFDYGKPVPVTIPPASAVLDPSALN